MIRRVVLFLLSFFPHFTIQRRGKPYLTRYWLLGGKTTTTAHPFLPFNLFLHVIHQSDDPPPHNHPWRWARSLILYGSYWETRLAPHYFSFSRAYGPGDINSISADTLHYLTLLTAEVWTLFLCGRKTGPWGFLTPEGIISPKEYVERNPGSTTNN